MESEVKYKDILVNNLDYLVGHINARDTRLWEKLIEKKVFLFDDANYLRVSSKESIILPFTFYYFTKLD